ncbi:MAG: DUF3096 domain-containing protein [Nanoarchaeota archaeon]
MVAISLAISGILAIVAGLLVIFVPKLLRWALGLYLIAIGLISFLGN